MLLGGMRGGRSVAKKPPRAKGIFISIEGLDGSGKTTQARHLKKWLIEQRLEVLLTYEPGGTEIGDQIRDVLHEMKNCAMHPKTELLLYNAARTQLVEEVIKPHLSKGGVIICDRFADSTRAYQGYGRGLSETNLEDAIRLSTGGLQPDLTIFLKLTPEEAITRARRRQRYLNGKGWNRMDAQNNGFHDRVYEGYEALASKDRGRWVSVDGSPAISEVAEEVKKVVKRKFQDRFNLTDRPSLTEEAAAQDPREKVSL